MADTLSQTNKQDTAKTIVHDTIIRVRYAETDKMGVVYNGEYLTYLEVGRTELMRSKGLPYTEFEKAGYILPLIESYIKYHESAFYDDLLTVRASLSTERKAVVKFEYNILRDNTTIATGYTVHSFVKSETGRPVKPPKIFTDTLQAVESSD